MMPGMQTQDGIGQIQERSVLVLVVNWNGADMTRDCCASLAAQTHRNLHVRVVDNGQGADNPVPGIGFAGIRERVGLLDGETAYRSLPGGFEIRITIPVLSLRKEA